MRLARPNNPVLSYININSIRNKFEFLADFIMNDVDILSIAETKLDESFSLNRFLLHGFKKPYRIDVSGNSGGLLTYVSSNFPSRQLNDYILPPMFQAIPIEITLRERKWFIISIYNPKSCLGAQFISNLSDLLDFYYPRYDDIVIIGDFNLEPSNNVLINFMSQYKLYNLVQKNTCFKSTRGTCIDLILTNRKFSFQLTNTLETGLSDFHHLIYTMFKCTYTKLSPITCSFRSYDKFDINEFRSKLHEQLIINGHSPNFNFSGFNSIFSSLLNIYAPLKHKIIRGNHKPFMSKLLRKEIMKRTHLKNIANKSGLKSDLHAYKRQRNLVVSLNNKAKKSFFSNIEIKKDAKSFWQACKPFMASKPINNKGRIMLNENGVVITDDTKIADIFNNYFTYITKTLDIPSWRYPAVYENDPITRAILKYRSHPSIIAIKRNSPNTIFSFSDISPETVYKYITDLKKGSIDTPLKILKSNADIITPFLTSCINSSFKNNSFPDELKLADIIPIHKKGDSNDKSNYRPISILPTISKVFERAIYEQISLFLLINFPNFYAALEKGFQLSILLCVYFKNGKSA